MDFSFEVSQKDKKTRARAGKIITPHGTIETPAFSPVATRASVRTLSPDDIKNCGSQVVLGNTYHLYLRPGVDTIRKMGGLHRFMDWPGPILTDSGGFQVMSLGALRTLVSSLALRQSRRAVLEVARNVPPVDLSRGRISVAPMRSRSTFTSPTRSRP